MIKRIGWIVLLIATGISLMGCFSNEKAEKEIGAPTLKTVSLQLQWVTQAQFAGYYVALEKGWYREAGIDLTIKPGGPDIVPVDTVASGTADFGTTLLADLAVAIEKSKPVISIGQIQQKNGLVLVTRKSSKINHPKDFVGRQVGV